jgi:ribosomal 50S subunit-recycling heat shock protein
MCDAGRVSISGRRAKAGTAVGPGDELALSLRDRFLVVKILEIPVGNVSKDRARTLYEITEERDVTTY